MPQQKIRDIRTATLSSVILGLYLSVPSEEYDSLTDAIGEMSGTIVNNLLLEEKLMKGSYLSVPEALTATLRAIGNLVGDGTARLRFMKTNEAELSVVDCPICEASTALSISPDKPICRLLGILINKVAASCLQRLGVEAQIIVNETNCRAQGAPACTFKVTWTSEKIVHTKYVEWEEQRADEECRARLDAIAVRAGMRTT